MLRTPKPAHNMSPKDVTPVWQRPVAPAGRAGVEGIQATHYRPLVEAVVFTTLSPLTLGLGLSLVKFSLTEPTLEHNQPGVGAPARV